MFWSKLNKSSWNCARNLAFPVIILLAAWNLCENLHCESVHVYFKELPNEREHYWPTIYRTGAAVVSTIEHFHMTSRRPYWCPKPILRELNSFLMQTLSFVPVNLHRCWPRKWKHYITYSLNFACHFHRETVGFLSGPSRCHDFLSLHGNHKIKSERDEE